MEYIDNSLDSAEILYNENKAYPYPIKIRVVIDSKNKSYIGIKGTILNETKNHDALGRSGRSSLGIAPRSLE